VAVFLQGGDVPPEARQGVAAELGLSETVFVDDAVRGEVRIFTPEVELDFAGHPMVGTAWLLAREREPVSTLRPPAGEVGVRYENGASFVTGRPEWGPQWEFEQLGSPADVDALDGPPGDLVGAWAWLDEAAGSVRARVFGPAVGVSEDEATGSAAIRLCAVLGRELDIHQGRGSRLRVRPLEAGRYEVGGRSALDEVADHPPP